MNLCPDCPAENPALSIDQRSWVKNGRCHNCHEILMAAKAERKALKRADKYQPQRLIQYLT